MGKLPRLASLQVSGVVALRFESFFKGPPHARGQLLTLNGIFFKLPLYAISGLKKVTLSKLAVPNRANDPECFFGPDREVRNANIWPLRHFHRPSRSELL